MSRTTDLEDGIVLAEAHCLDRIALLGSETNDLAEQGPALVRRYAEAVIELRDNADDLGDLDVEDLLDTWAHWVVEMAARWHRGDSLAMSPFRSTALKALADYWWDGAMETAEANTQRLRGDLLAGRTPTLPADAVVMPNPERLVRAGHLTEKDRADLLRDPQTENGA